MLAPNTVEHSRHAIKLPPRKICWLNEIRCVTVPQGICREAKAGVRAVEQTIDIID